MKLNKIELLDFRQFKGRQTIEFSEDSEKNVTVIYGANGLGKTGIFRALMFCLYGERNLSQDESPDEQKKEGLHLVNEVTLKENIGNPVVMQVSMYFSHNQYVYQMTRKLHGLMNPEGVIIQNPETVELQTTDPQGNTSPIEKNPDIIQSKIQGILSERLRDYFLFDGERIERLTRNTAERKKDVQKGIRALLNLDALELAIKGLGDFIVDTEREIKNKSTGEPKVVASDIDKINKNIEQQTEQQAHIEQEIRRIEHREEYLSKQIKANEKTAELEQERQRYINLKNDKTVEKEGLRNLMADQLNLSGQLLAFNVTEQLREELELHRKKGELPPAIRKEFIEKLLHDEQCICGAPLDSQHQEARKQLYTFLKQHDVPGLGKETEDFLVMINRASGAYSGLSIEFERLLRQNHKLDEEIGELEVIINQKDEKLGEVDTSIDDLIKERSQCTKDRDCLKIKIAILAKEINNFNKQLEGLRKKREILVKNQKTLERLEARYKLARDTKIELEKIYGLCSNDMRKQLEVKSSEIFSRLADDSTKKDIKSLSIDSKYILDVLNWAGQPRLGEISAGQRQIVSLSFILGLIHVTGNLKVPLFMDTPFGRLSGVHRDHLLQTIPQFASQWILLATDTEFTAVEADALRQTNTWATIYELVKEQEGVTRIQRKEVHQFVPKRSAGF